MSKEKLTDFEKLMKFNSNELQGVLEIIQVIGATGISARKRDGAFYIGLDPDIIKEKKEQVSALNDKSLKDTLDYIAALIYLSHQLEDHQTTIKEVLEDTEFEEKASEFENIIETSRAHGAYPEIKYMLEVLGNKLTKLEGRRITINLKETKLKNIELVLSYINIEGNMKKLRLVSTESQLNKLISDLKKLLEE